MTRLEAEAELAAERARANELTQELLDEHNRYAEALAAKEQAEAYADDIEKRCSIAGAQLGMAQERIAALTEALKECAEELAAWVQGHYELMLNYPSEKRRFERDMGPVHRARALLARPTKAEEP